MNQTTLQKSVQENTAQLDYFTVEAEHSRRFVREYLHPILTEHFGKLKKLSILSDGCGVGGEVEELSALGYRAFGIDPGPRRYSWGFQSCPDRLLASDGVALPFKDASFDAVLSFGVLNHVGVENNFGYLHREVKQLRHRYVTEMIRVTRPGGAIIIGVINRLCPIDPFHASNFGSLRVHGPRDIHSISFGQIYHWSNMDGVSHQLNLLPFDHRVFSWEGLRTRWWGRRWFPQILKIINCLFGSEWSKPLRSSWLNPFLLVKITKSDGGVVFSRRHPP